MTIFYFMWTENIIDICVYCPDKEVRELEAKEIWKMVSHWICPECSEVQYQILENLIKTLN